MEISNQAMAGLNDAFQRMQTAAARMTPNNPDGFERPLLTLHQADVQAQTQLSVLRHWNENIGRLLDILA